MYALRVVVAFACVKSCRCNSAFVSMNIGTALFLTCCIMVFIYYSMKVAYLSFAHLQLKNETTCFIIYILDG